MSSCSSGFVIYLSFLFIGSYKQYKKSFIPLQTSVVTLFQHYCFSCLFHYISIDHEQSNALHSTLALCKWSKLFKPIAFINAWCLSFVSALDTMSTIISFVGKYFIRISWFFYFNFNEVMLYINMFGARLMCGVLCKYYASLILAHDGFRFFLYVSHICQKLSKPNHHLRAMASGHVLRLHHRKCNGWLFLPFSWNDSKANKKSCTPVVDPQLFASNTQSIL